jgi:hypothetical protein
MCYTGVYTHNIISFYFSTSFGYGLCNGPASICCRLQAELDVNLRVCVVGGGGILDKCWKRLGNGEKRGQVVLVCSSCIMYYTFRFV